MMTKWDINVIVEEYADTITRICYSYGKNYDDTQDIMQNVFLKLMRANPEFDSKEHEKAWIIRVTINSCKDLLRSFFRKKTIPLDDLLEKPQFLSNDHREVIEAVLSLSQKYRDVIYLHYYEGYTASEISQILGKNVNTIYTLLTRSKKMLRD